MTRLTLYTCQEYLTPEFRANIFPVLLDLYFLEDPDFAQYFDLVNHPEDADILVFPIDITRLDSREDQKRLEELEQLSRQMDKPLWVKAGGDWGGEICSKQEVVFRLAGQSSKMSERHIVLPAFIQDPYKTVFQSDFAPIQPGKLPTIGFVGYAKDGPMQMLKEYYGHLKRVLDSIRSKYRTIQPFYPAAVDRYKRLEGLMSDRRVETDIIRRTRYRAGANSPVLRKKSEVEFFQNIYNNLYTYCPRGVGNFSVRLYETLAVGRIPIVPDTDCRFPLPDRIDWPSHAVLVPALELDRLVDHVLDFHNRRSKEELIRLQYDNRDLWKSKFSRIGYFREIYKMFSVVDQS